MLDLSKLTDEQLDIADKVAAAAKKHGLNPDFVLPMVMAESGFNPNAESKKGAIGVMQIMPKTADLYKCKNPKDVDQNIDCGMAVLSDLVAKKHIGNDPYKVLSGYNAGPDTKYFTTGKIEDLPDETINHMDRVSSFYGGNLPLVSAAAPEEKENASPETQPNTPPIAEGNAARAGMGFAGTGSGLPGTGAEAAAAQPRVTSGTAPFGETGPNWQMAVPGAQMGLGIGAGLKTAEAGLAGVNLVKDIVGQVRNGKPFGQALADTTGITAGEKWGSKTGYGTGPGTVQESSSRYQRRVNKGPISGKMDKLYGPAQPGESPQLSQRLIDRANAAEAAAIEDAAPLTRMSRSFSRVAPILSQGAKILGSGLGGATALAQGYGALENYKKYGLTPDNAVQGISALGGALGTVPYLPFQAAGLALQLPEAGLGAYRYLHRPATESGAANYEDFNQY